MIQAARGDKIDGLEAASVLKRSTSEKRFEDWEEKVLHGQYLRQTKEVKSDQISVGIVYRMIQAARGDKLDSLEAGSVLKRSKKEKRFEDWEEKVLHGQYLRQTKEVISVGFGLRM